MTHGNITIPRALLDEALLSNADACRLYLFLLAKMDDAGLVKIKVRTFAKDFGASYQRVRTLLNLLEATQKITQSATQSATQISLCISANKSRRVTQSATQLSTQSATHKSQRFIPPSEDDVKGYVLEKGYHFNPEQFIPYYEKQGWKQANGQPLIDWKAGCRYWETRWKAKYGEKYYYQIAGQSGGSTEPRSRYYSLRNATEAILQQSGNIDSMLDDYIGHT